MAIRFSKWLSSLRLACGFKHNQKRFKEMQNLEAVVFQRHQKYFYSYFGLSNDLETQKTRTERKPRTVFIQKNPLKKLSEDYST